MKLGQLTLVAALLFAILFTGCTPTEEAAPEEPVAQEPVEPAFDVQTYVPIQYMFMYREIAPVEGTRYFELERGAGLERGDRLTSNGVEVPGKLQDSDRDYSFFEVETKDGERLFMRSSYFVPNAQLGVISGDNAVLYNEASRLEPSSNILPRMTLVVVPKDDAVTEGNGFYEVTAWDDERKTPVAKLYVLQDQVSLKQGDVESLIFFLKAEESSNEVQKKALLESAVEYKDSAFIVEIDEALTALVGEPEEEEAAQPVGGDREAYSFAAFGVINTQTVDVHDKPDESTAVIGTVDMGLEVTLMERTAEEFPHTTVGETGYWYKITNPEGWVFGSYIDLN